MNWKPQRHRAVCGKNAEFAALFAAGFAKKTACEARSASKRV
jgi:hypothetical protein